ncbi:MAG: HEAT repeat domain-containing protein, partial [Verrucomicrobiota bacterium]
HGVRMEAAKALQAIHSDEALAELLASRQSDARVRSQVAASIGGFFSPNAFTHAAAAISSEKNPDIRAQWIRALGNYSSPESRQSLVALLGSESYRNTLADAAISAMRTQDDPFFIQPLQQTLQQGESRFTTRGFASGLDALAYIARNEKEKDSVREFLTRKVNHKKKGIQLAAIAALGTLEDPKGRAVLATFASASRESDERKVAEKALVAIRTADNPSNNLKALRDEILDLKKDSRETKKDLEALRKKIETKPEKTPVKTVRSPRAR